MTAPPPYLRAVIADVVRDLVKEMAADTVREQLGTAAAGSAGSASPAAVAPAAPLPPASGGVAGWENVTPADPRTRLERVRMADDADLDRFARHLLTLFENPKNRQDLRAGRLRFRLDGASSAAAGPPTTQPAVRVDAGAVTERQVKEAAGSGRRIVLGRKAVLTPLGREKARALGVSIEKER